MEFEANRCRRLLERFDQLVGVNIATAKSFTVICFRRDSEDFHPAMAQISQGLRAARKPS